MLTAKLFPGSRKGDFSIVLLVFLVLFVVLVSLFIFGTSSGKIVAQIQDAGIINKVKLEKSTAEFYIAEIAKNSLVESYKEIILDGNYIENPSFDLELNARFGVLSTTLNEDFKEIFNEKFKENFESCEFQEEYLKSLKPIIRSGEFVTYFDRENIRVNISGMEIKEFSENINVTSSPVISLEVNLNKIGLADFNKVYQVKEACKTKESSELIEECFENSLKGFDAEITEKTLPNEEKAFLVILKSKKVFLIDDKLENIKINFLLV